jgi:hypothetical protein
MINWFERRNETLSSVQQWSYLVMPLTSGEEEDLNVLDHQIMLNGIGQAGWELVAMYRDHMIFKKPYAEV